MGSLDSIIATLNHIDVGEIDKIASALTSVREELESRGLADLVPLVEQCREALGRGELSEFRRLKETLVARLGHVRQKMN